MAPAVTPTVDKNITLPLALYTAERAGELRSRPKFSLHLVKKGESLKSIADKHGIPYQLLLETNLSYNLATLTKRNPDLIDRIQFFVDHNGEGIHRVPLSLEPGQTILIPETWRNKNRRHDAETVYALNASPEKIDTYSSDKKHPALLGDLLAGLREENRRNDEMSREEAEHVRVESGLDRVRQDHAEAEPEHVRASNRCEINQDLEPYPCHSFHAAINMVESNRDRCLTENGASYDSDSDGWFDPQEYSALMAGCIDHFPLPQP